jgi:hypothetical protein
MLGTQAGIERAAKASGRRGSIPGSRVVERRVESTRDDAEG